MWWTGLAACAGEQLYKAAAMQAAAHAVRWQVKVAMHE
jgi:hypothetical protein